MIKFVGCESNGDDKKAFGYLFQNNLPKNYSILIREQNPIYPE